MQVHFTYVGVDGRIIDISFEDASPLTTLEVQARENGAGLGFEAYRLLKEQYQERYSRLTEMKLGPREAVQRSWDQVLAAARKEGIADPRPLPSFIDLSEEARGWKITYLIKDPAVPTPDWNKKPFKLEGSLVGIFVVDERTGEVISSEYLDNRGKIVFERP